MGNPEDPEGKAAARAAVAPELGAARSTTPLLVAQGANDPRVKKAESEQIVIALRDRGFPVEYILAPDEGHGYQRPVQQHERSSRAAEEFFAKHLAGRAQKDDDAGGHRPSRGADDRSEDGGAGRRKADPRPSARPSRRGPRRRNVELQGARSPPAARTCRSPSRATVEEDAGDLGRDGQRDKLPMGEALDDRGGQGHARGPPSAPSSRVRSRSTWPSRTARPRARSP